MQNCPMCYSEITDDNPALIAQAIEAARIDWEEFAPDAYYRPKKIGDKFEIPGVGEAEYVAGKFYDGPPGYGGDLPQGTEFDAYVVLKVGENFYRKTGKGDSYNDISWNSVVLPVKATPKTVTVYDFA